MRIEKRGGVLKVRLHGKWVRYEPPDEESVRQGEAIKQQTEWGNLVSHGKAVLKARRKVASARRTQESELLKQYIRKQSRGSKKEKV